MKRRPEGEEAKKRLPGKLSPEARQQELKKARRKMRAANAPDLFGVENKREGR